MALTFDGVLLGLGSVVRVENEKASGLFVVLARGAYRPDLDSSVAGRYLVGPHPYGEAPDRETFPILADEIVEVVFEGYTDENDEAFLMDLLDQMEHGRRPMTRAVQFADALTEIPEYVEDVDGGEGVELDPFAVLRKKLSMSGME
ncbi:DUF4176 domain-containing protein [Leucobacter insecticola]|uniref:DUF4176 domain-containing protein n=1 Tax=Leucobacter insecticola TaxID=2714934 RepID=A0A6G8FIN2_9MICO|nr:DUF4176 domain-containing protein [Leucobacter insecticola]QIM16224.1 DUF4176 domain-containing protein [Leucobacter insecticola]